MASRKEVNMPADLMLPLIGVAAALACAGLGGGLYEFSVVDPFWPRRPNLIQPTRGGISRKRFWIPAHTVFELTLIGSLVAAWPLPELRTPLLVALGSHGTMRIWSAFDFIPRALAFERAEPATITEEAARRWTRRSLLRLPLDLITCCAMLVAFFHASSIG
jgi:hypothetical protein